MANYKKGKQTNILSGVLPGEDKSIQLNHREAVFLKYLMFTRPVNWGEDITAVARGLMQKLKDADLIKSTIE